MTQANIDAVKRLDLLGKEISDVSGIEKFKNLEHLDLDKNQIYSILSRVKNNILDWALTLEESGIVGRDYSFSEEEKKIAQEKTELTNYITNFWGTAIDVQMQQGNTNSEQSKF